MVVSVSKYRWLWLALMWLAALAVIAMGLNGLGIHALGDVNSWRHWISAHRWLLLAWRLCVYVATGCGWWWMRGRVIRREPDAVTRLRRAEVAALIAVLALESSALMQAP